MKTSPLAPKRDFLPTAAAVVAVLFGLLTVASGGRTLFGGEAARQAAGAVVDSVLWFNFCAGFGYIVAGIGLWRRRRWSMWAAVLIAVATAVVFVVFGAHVAAGGAYELRTVAAMALRTTVWVGLAWIAHRSTRNNQ